MKWAPHQTFSVLTCEMGLSVSRHVYCDDFPRAIHAFLPIYGDAIEMIMGECTCIATNAVGSCILQEFEWKKVENCKKKSLENLTFLWGFIPIFICHGRVLFVRAAVCFLCAWSNYL